MLADGPPTLCGMKLLQLRLLLPVLLAGCVPLQPTQYPPPSSGGAGGAPPAGSDPIEVDLGGAPQPGDTDAIEVDLGGGQTVGPGGAGGEPAPVATAGTPPERPSVGLDSGAPLYGGTVELVVLHTNDVHGQVLPVDATWTRDPDDTSGGLVRLAAKVEALRAEAEAEGKHVLLLDGGDWYQGTPEGVTDTGRPFVKALAGIGYDAMAVGNHEFDFGLAAFDAIVEHARPPIVAANVFLSDAPNAPRPDWAVPYRIVERGPLEIALVGFVTTSTPVISHPETRALDFRDPVEVLGQVLAGLPDTVDLVIPVGHLGVDTDRELAFAHPELPLIVGGHSHTRLRNGMQVNDTLLVQAGAKSTTLGRVDLTFNTRAGA